jgi:hypothetical protein
MPILGITASSITGSSLATSYESIATVTVGGGGSSSISFTSIPATYKHLQVRILSGQGNATQGASMQFNSDTGSNYKIHALDGSGSTVATAAGGATPYVLYYSGSSSGLQATVVDILDYANTNKYKVSRSLQGYDLNGSGHIVLLSHLWMNTNAITSILIDGTGSNFIQYSSFALYGIKGA